MNLVPNKQLLPNVPFQSTTNRERKNCVRRTKCKRLLEMCIVQHVEKKSVFTIQPMTWLVSTTVKSAKLAATFGLLRTKNLQICCLTVTLHIVLKGRGVATSKKKNHLHFWRNLSANQIQAHPNLNQKSQKFFHLWYSQPKLYLHSDFIHFQSTSKFNDFPSLQRWFWVVFGPDSVTLTVKDLVQEMTVGSQEIPLAAWSL